MNRQTGKTDAPTDQHQDSKKPENLSADEMRQGEVVLKSRWQRWLIIGAFAAAMVLLIFVSMSIAP